MLNDVSIFWWIGTASFIVFIGTIVLVPVVVVRIPPDHFIDDHHRRTRWHHLPPLLWLTLLALKNILGYILLIAGVALLFLPGQGLLTVIIGFMLIDFPGKYRFERWLIGHSHILRTINWLRERRGREPLRIVLDLKYDTESRSANIEHSSFHDPETKP